MNPEIVRSNKPETPDFTPDSIQECLYLEENLDAQISEWYLQATTRTAVHTRGVVASSMLETIIRDCKNDDVDRTLISMQRHPKEKMEAASQQHRAERMFIIAPYAKSPDLSEVELKDDTLEPFINGLRSFVLPDKQSNKNYHKALEYLYRIHIIREQVEKRIDTQLRTPHLGPTHDTYMIEQIFVRLAQDVGIDLYTV